MPTPITDHTPAGQPTHDAPWPVSRFLPDPGPPNASGPVTTRSASGIELTISRLPSAEEYCALLADVGLSEAEFPGPRAVVRITMPGTLAKGNWAGYTFEGFGLGFRGMPLPNPFAARNESGQGFAGIDFALWLRRVRLEGIPAYVEARWHAGGGETIAVLGLERVASLRAANAAMRGLRLLRLLSPSGQKAGNYHDPWPWVLEIWRDVLDKAWRERGEIAHLNDLADALNHNPSTIHRWPRERKDELERVKHETIMKSIRPD